MQSPEVTVVIPTRERWDLLSTAALPSALGQQEVDLEVVIVDDGSCQPRPDAIDLLQDPRVRLVRHGHRRGVAHARNAGIREARGEWIAFLDDDDLWCPRKLRRQIDAAVASDGTFAYGGAAAVAEDRSWLYSLPPAEPLGLARALLARNVIWGGSSNVLARREVLVSLGGFDEQLFQLSDWDLWIRLALEGVPVAVSEVVVGCLVHDRSMLLVSDDDVFDEFSYLRAKHHAAGAEYGVRPDRRLFTRWVALGHRRAGRRRRSVTTYLRGVVRDGDVTNVVRAVEALVGPRPRAVANSRFAPRRARDRHGSDAPEEPEWLASYRRMPGRTSAQATSNASSPTES